MVETLSDLYFHVLENYQRDAYMYHKRDGFYEPISTEKFGRSVRNFSLGLMSLGLKPGDRMVILAESSPRWVITELACACAGATIVPIHSVLTPEQIKYIINDSEAGIVVFSSLEMWQKLKAVKADIPAAQHFITFEKEGWEDVLTFASVEERGRLLGVEKPKLLEEKAGAVKAEDLAAIIYTSGTTGVPKGAMLTHGNFISNTKSASTVIKVLPTETALSFLPLSHTLEHIGMLAYLYNGCTIAFAESIDTLLENLKEIRPHLMVSAPRIFEKIYAGVINKVLSSPPLRRKIFFWALKTGKQFGENKLKGRPQPLILRLFRALAHRLVFRKIIALTGGRIRLFVSGGAPLSKDIAEFFYALGFTILEGYGLTETSPVVTLNSLEQMKFGTVGHPIPEVEVKIAGDGEILTRGPHIMKGYHKMERETAEVFEGDWFKTGDIGHIDEEGYLVITDRKKDIIVTSGGKNVAPQQIENLLKTNAYIDSAVVLGDKKKFISALIVPNFEKLEEYAKEKNLTFGTRADLVKKKRITDFLMQEIEVTCQDLARYEKIKKIAVLDREFDIVKGEVTPTLKVKRNIIAEKYKDIIDELYADNIVST
jgi:long-chain acyl-CoA synthetase